jgi:hypothetical protein
MALITKPKTFVDNETLLYTDLNSLMDTIYNEFNGSISNTNIASNAAIVSTKISGTAVTLTGTETLTNKTLTSPTVNTPAIASPVLSGAGAVTAGTLGYGATDHNLLVGDGTTNNPIHIGHWVAWTPSYTNLTVGSGTNVGAYCQIGKTVHFRTYWKFGAGSAVGTYPTLTLPVALSAVGYPIGVVTLVDNGTGTYTGAISDGAGATTIIINCIGTSGAVAQITQINAGNPWTWTTNDAIAITGTYEAA